MLGALQLVGLSLVSYGIQCHVRKHLDFPRFSVFRLRGERRAPMHLETPETCLVGLICECKSGRNLPDL